MISHFRFRRNLDSVLAGALGFGIIWVFTRHSGIGISPDSVNYLSAARSLLEGRGLWQYDQAPLVDFPALYPLFLAAVSWVLHADPLRWAPLVNGVLFAFLIYLTGSLLNSFRPFSSLYKRILLLCVAFSPCLLEIYPMLWSETLFLIWVLLFVAALVQYLRMHTLPSLWVCAILAGLAALTRYAGVTVIGTGFLLLVLDRGINGRQRIGRAMIFLACSGGMLALNLLRNHVAAGFLTGNRQKGITPFGVNISYFGEVICEWLPLPQNHPVLSFWVGLGTLAILVLLLLWYVFPKYPIHTCETVGTVFGLLYCLFILFSATFSRYQPLNSRLLCPFFIPFLWTLTYWIPPALGRMGRWKRRGALGLLLGAFVVFQYHQWAADWETYDGVKDAGIPGYTEDPFPQEAIVQFIREKKIGCGPDIKIYSNAADAVYFFSGCPARLLPQKAFPDQVRRYFLENGNFLVWFNDVDNPDLPPLDTILSQKKMTLVEKFPEGAVYRSDP